MQLEVRRRLAWAWRLPLIVAILAMLSAAALVAMDQRELSDTFVTMGFAIGMLSVPIWLLTDRGRA